MLILSGAAAGAQTTVGYFNGETDASNYLTDGGLTLSISSGAANQVGILFGSGSVTKVGAGTLTLGATNPFSGPLSVNGGTLVAGASNSLGTFETVVDNSLGLNSALIIASGASVNVPVIMANGAFLSNNGTMGSGGSDFLVSIYGSGGRVINNGTMNSNSVVVFSDVGVPATVINNGIMRVTGAVVGDPAVGIFTGTVINNAGGKILSDSSGVFMGDNNSTVINHGLINGQGTNFASGAGMGVLMQGGNVINTGTIIGKNAGVVASGNFTLTNSGIIQGQNRPSVLALGGATINNLAGGEIRGGAGLVALASLLGPTTLNNAGLISGNVLLGPARVNTVTLSTGSRISGAMIIGANPGSRLILDGSGTSTFSNALVGALAFGNGTLTKQGTGTWIIDRAMPYAGDTIVNEGKLVLNGSVNGDVQLNGGILGGTGPIGGNLFNNGGVLNIGSSPGIMNVAGNFAQGSAGVWVVEVTGTVAGQFDQLNVGGNASLNGALLLDGLPGYTPKIGDTFNFLTVGGSPTGQFSSFTSNLNSALQGYLVYDGSGVPSIVIGQGLYTRFAQTPNQRAVAANLDTFSTTGQSPALINLLNSLPGTSLPSAYDQIAPDEYGSMGRPILSYNAAQQSNLQRRFADLRAGSSGFSANGFTLLGFDRSLLLAGGGDYMASQIATNPNKSPMRVAKDNKWGFFVNGAGQFGDMHSDGNGVGYDFTTGGINVGMDYRLSDSVVIGASLGYANSSTDTDAAGGSIQANNAKALLYASWFNQGFYVNGALGGGGTSYDTKRNVLGSQVSGTTSGGDFTTFVGGGYDFKAGALTMGPAASLEYSYVNIGSFTESGGLAPLQIQEQNFDSLRSRLGVLASYLCEVGGVRVVPTMNAAWQHEFLETTQSVSARFANGSGGIFGVQGAEAERDSALFGVGVDVAWTPAISTYLSYDAEVAQRYSAQTLSGGVKLKF